MAKRIRFERGQELQERACMVAAICIQPHVRKKNYPTAAITVAVG